MRWPGYYYRVRDWLEGMEVQWEEVGAAGFWSAGFVFVEGDQWSKHDVLGNWPACKGL